MRPRHRSGDELPDWVDGFSVTDWRDPDDVGIRPAEDRWKAARREWADEHGVVLADPVADEPWDPAAI